MNTQPLVTYKIKYTFPDYPNEWETTIYCDFEPNDILTASELKERLETEIIGEEIDSLEIVKYVRNTFCDDNLLSLMAISILNSGHRRIGKKNLPDTHVQSLEFKDKKIALDYISIVFRNLNAEEKKEYKERLINEIRTSITCYSYRIDREAVNYILNIIGEELKADDSVKNKLARLTNGDEEKKRRYEILLRLTNKDNVNLFRERLDKIYKHYRLAQETKQYRVAAICYLIMMTYNAFEKSIEYKYSTIVRNLCDYWGVSEPNFRRTEIERYVDCDILQAVEKRNLRNKIKNETYIECIKVLDTDLWRNLKI